MASYPLSMQHHGKSKVRLGRVWREGNVHHMVEWNVNTMLDSDMAHAYVKGTNTGMTATDTQKNTVGAKRGLYTGAASPQRNPAPWCAMVALDGEGRGGTRGCTSIHWPSPHPICVSHLRSSLELRVRR